MLKHSRHRSIKISLSISYINSNLVRYFLMDAKSLKHKVKVD